MQETLKNKFDRDNLTIWQFENVKIWEFEW